MALTKATNGSTWITCDGKNVKTGWRCQVATDDQSVLVHASKVSRYNRFDGRRIVYSEDGYFCFDCDKDIQDKKDMTIFLNDHIQVIHIR
jgi:hypothetical protein